MTSGMCSEACTCCPCCDPPGTLATAAEVAEVAVNLARLAPQRFTVWRCDRCGSLHCQQPIDLATYYRDYLRLPWGYGLYWVYRNRLCHLRRLGLRRHHTLLELGCGSGQFLHQLARWGYPHTTGYDPHCPPHIQPPAASARFDFVVAYDVLEHLEDPRVGLVEMGARLAPGGTLVIATPDASGLTLTPADAMALHQPYHRHILSRQALVDLAHQQGLRVVDWSRRTAYDTTMPGINLRTIVAYVRATGNWVDVLEGPLRLGVVLRMPRLWLWALLGYAWPLPGQMTVGLRRLAEGDGSFGRPGSGSFSAWG